MTFDDGRPKAYLPEQIAKAFPPAQAPLRPERGAPVDVSAEAAEAPRPSHASLQIGSSQVSIEACLARVRAGDHWHDNLVRLTGHWIARGWSDAEILTAAEALTLPGYTIAQTRREIAKALRQLRNKRESLPPKKHGNIPL